MSASDGALKFDFKDSPSLLHSSVFIVPTEVTYGEHWSVNDNERKRLTRNGADSRASYNLLQCSNENRYYCNGLTGEPRSKSESGSSKLIDFHLPSKAVKKSCSSIMKYNRSQKESIEAINVQSCCYHPNPTMRANRRVCAKSKKSKEKGRKPAENPLCGSHISASLSHFQSSDSFKQPIEATMYKNYCSAPIGIQCLPWRLQKSNKANSEITTLPPLDENECHSSLTFHIHALKFTNNRHSRIPHRQERRMVGSASLEKPKKISGYPDPLINGPPRYQKRLTELFGLVSDTIRNEKDVKSKGSCIRSSTSMQNHIEF